MANIDAISKTFEHEKVEDRLYKWNQVVVFIQKLIPKTIYNGHAASKYNRSIAHGSRHNNTLQDILARWRRMQGYASLWVPGTDHASIATEARLWNN